MATDNWSIKSKDTNHKDVESLDEDLYVEKVPSRFSHHLNGDYFEKFKHKNKEWD